MSRRILQRTSHSISGMFVFLLIGAFALASIMLVLSGINVYRHVTDEASSNSERQVTLSYLVNKVHAYDGTGDVRVDTRGSVSMLCLADAFAGGEYETRIYYHDGAMYELFIEKGDVFDLDDGVRLTDVQKIEFVEVKPSLLRVEVTLPDGSAYSLHMALSADQAG